MATTNIHFTCGCGYTTPQQSLAEQHSDGKTHIMYITGDIRPVIPRVKPALRQQVRPVESAKPTTIFTELTELKKKLQVV